MESDIIIKKIFIKALVRDLHQVPIRIRWCFCLRRNRLHFSHRFAREPRFRTAPWSSEFGRFRCWACRSGIASCWTQAWICLSRCTRFLFLPRWPLRSRFSSRLFQCPACWQFYMEISLLWGTLKAIFLQRWRRLTLIIFRWDSLFRSWSGSSRRVQTSGGAWFAKHRLRSSRGRRFGCTPIFSTSDGTSGGLWILPTNFHWG